jgi:hypothetical protein
MVSMSIDCAGVMVPQLDTSAVPRKREDETKDHERESVSVFPYAMSALSINDKADQRQEM